MVNREISSQLDDRSKPQEQVDALSPEDFAWVDSCLIKDLPDTSDDNWNQLKESLLEIINLHPVDFESSAAISDNFLGYTNDIDMLPSNNADESTFPIGITDDPPPVNKAKKALENALGGDNIETSPSLAFQGNPFLPTYNDEAEGNENIQSGSLSETETEPDPPINDIFRVWDLNLPAVEDELAEQLNKALSENSIQSDPPMVKNPTIMEDLKEDLLNDLINGILDMSLEQNE